MLFSPKILPSPNSKPPFLYLKTSNQKTNKQKKQDTHNTTHVETQTHRHTDTEIL